MSISLILDTLFIQVVPFFFAIVLHEISHGVAAYCLGDDTAKREGRFKLYTHFDLWGSLIIPVLLILGHSPFIIGYAKPVPVDIRKFKDPVADMAIVAIAGPLCNLLLAVISAWLLKHNFDVMPGAFQKFSGCFIMTNLSLFFFNLVPIPPLDGSRIVAAIIPTAWLEKYYALESFGFFILIAVEMTSRYVSGIIGYDVSLFHLFIGIPANGILQRLFST
ncbi:site-2 protease family protein [Alphaproteobacteria bacterium]|nr:site-2 protease family protein [Alphaproteobacteria bacterium]